MNSLGVVLGQEMQRFNRLLERLGASLHQLTKALKVTVIIPAFPCYISAESPTSQHIGLLLCAINEPCESARTEGQCFGASPHCQVAGAFPKPGKFSCWT